jgi:hypothetical protein
VKFTFLLSSLILSTIVFAAECRISLSAHSGNREELIKASQLSTKKSITNKGLSESENYWALRIAEIKTPEESYRALKQIVEGTSVLSTAKWLEILDVAVPLLMTKLEALDNFGVIDLAIVNDYINRQIDRMSGFTDSIYATALEKAFNDSATPETSSKLSLREIMNQRKNVNMGFSREFTGNAAKEIFNTFQIPERQDAEGNRFKILRATNHKISIRMEFNAKTKEYFVEVLADKNANTYSNFTPNTYTLNVTRTVSNRISQIGVSSSATLYGVYAVSENSFRLDKDYRQRGSSRTIRINDKEGNLVMSLIAEKQDYSHESGKLESGFRIQIPMVVIKSQKNEIDPATEIRQSARTAVDVLGVIRANRRRNWENHWQGAGILERSLMIFDPEFWRD